MQNKIKIWRASNPVFLICCYLLIGIFCFKASYQYCPSLSEAQIILILCSTLSLFIISKHIAFFKHEASILPTLIVIVWGFCIAQFNQDSGFLNAIVSSEWIIYLRTAFINKIDYSFTNQASNEFVKTLLFGTKSNLSNELKSAYQTLGIMHIIAISGMHLDILFKLLEKGTAWFPATKWAGWIKFVLLLVVVWTYTCIANAGPSVVRASLFFTIVLIARFFKLNLFSFNAISTGILLMLLYSSHVLSSIGLQLSYAAVIGIYFFNPCLSILLKMENKILKHIWENLTISFAAQLTTLPIILYYFHSISSLSIIGNFLFIPASNLLLYGLIFFMITPNFAGISIWIASWINAYIAKMNELLFYIYQVLQKNEPVYEMGILGLIYYYFVLFTGYYWLKNKAPNYFFHLLLGSCIYSLLKLFSI